MSMSKKDFIALASSIRAHNLSSKPNGVSVGVPKAPFSNEQLSLLADFCSGQNSNFNRQRWLDYIAGKVGPSGGRSES